MSEKITNNTVDILRSPNQLSDLYSLDIVRLRDIELESIGADQLSKSKILQVDSDQRPLYIINTILDALKIRRLPGDSYDSETGSLKAEDRPDAEHTLGVPKQVTEAVKWYEDYVARYGRRAAGDRLMDMFEMSERVWSESDLYRMFEILRQRVTSDRSDNQSQAIILAHRIGLVMMAQETAGYTIGDESE